MGKTYTATAVLQLVERGFLELDAPVNRYLTEFRITNPLGGRDVTVRDLLTHRSGLATDVAGSDFLPPRPLAAHLKETYGGTTFKPYRNAIPMWTAPAGERYQYSNLGTATLGYLVEVTNPEGLPFSDYVQKHIIDPLGMTSTMYPHVALAISMNHWPVPDDATARYGEANLIIDFVVSWLQRARAGDQRVPPEHTRPWNYSYVAGLILAERLGGALGITTPVTEAMVQTMVAGAHERAVAGEAAPLWDPEGFRAGLDDMVSTGLTLDAITAFMRSDRLRVGPEELELILRKIGGRGGLPRTDASVAR